MKLLHKPKSTSVGITMDHNRLEKLDQRLSRLIMLYGTLDDAILYEEGREYIQELIELEKSVKEQLEEFHKMYQNPNKNPS